RSPTKPRRTPWTTSSFRDTGEGTGAAAAPASPRSRAMKRLLLAVLGLAVVSAAAHAWPPPGPPDVLVPRGGTLDICTAQVDGGDVVLLWAGTRTVYEKRVVTKKVEGKDVPVEVTVAVPVAQQRKDKIALKEVRAFGGDGRPLPPEALADRLKQPTT